MTKPSNGVKCFRIHKREKNSRKTGHGVVYLFTCLSVWLTDVARIARVDKLARQP